MRKNDRIVVKTTIDKFQKSEKANDLIKMQKKIMTNEKLRIFIKRTTKSILNNSLITKHFKTMMLSS
jgi:hypothetical protein